MDIETTELETKAGLPAEAVVTHAEMMRDVNRSDVYFQGQSGHPLLQCICPLLTHREMKATAC